MTTAMIQATGLEKNFGKVKALRGLDLTVPQGTVLGLLGPNGAGKTTAVRILTTLLTPDSGQATVAGVDVLADPQGVRSRIGLSGQYAAVDEHLTGFENLEMVGRLYGLPRTKARTRATELLERFGLADAGNRPSKTYSGGMRRRLDLAGALVAEPPVLVLDEPTTGLDPRSRLGMWDVIRDLIKGGSTLLLTTQYLEEADHLADEIVVIDHGKAIARGTADQLKRETGGERVALTLESAADSSATHELLARISGGEVYTADDPQEFAIPAAHGVKTLTQVLRELDAASITVVDISLRRPTLDDVFLSLTGQSTDGADETADAQTTGGKR